MTTKRRALALTATAAAAAAILTGCSDHQRASDNLSTAADHFEINRRITFINGITGDHMLAIEGKCAIKDEEGQLEVTCRVAEDEYEKHFLGLSDNVTYIAEQLDTADVSVYHHRIVFKPEALLPGIEVQTGKQ
jgi:hypothetical protein